MKFRLSGILIYLFITIVGKKEDLLDVYNTFGSCIGNPTGFIQADLCPGRFSFVSKLVSTKFKSFFLVTIPESLPEDSTRKT